jgi:hypothetical protein
MILSMLRSVLKSNRSLAIAVAITLVVLSQGSGISGADQTTAPLTDDDAYAVYATALAQYVRQSPTLVIQQQTEMLAFACDRNQVLSQPEWVPVLQDFETNNRQPRRLADRRGHLSRPPQRPFSVRVSATNT